MREFVRKVLGTTEGSVGIELFHIWHILYIAIIVGTAIGLAIWLKKKDTQTKTKVLSILAIILPSLYILDLFLMPLAGVSYGGFIDKLPFHICTFMGIWVPFAQFNKKFAPIKDVIAILTLVSSIMYITYPGSAIGADYLPWCYKVVQTFVFHGTMLIWGFLSITTKSIEMDIRKCWKEAVGLVVVAVWAAIGNYFYYEFNGSSSYDWFFITGSTFPFVPTPLMPFAVITAVFGMVMIIYGLYYLVRHIMLKNEEKKANQ